MATITLGIKPHSMPMIEPSSEPSPHEIMTSTPPSMIEPLLPQLEIPMSPLDTVTHGFDPHAVPTMEPPSKPQPTLPPEIWSQMNRRARKYWLQQHK